MVTEVSATLVATTTLRRGLGAKARSCCSGGKSPCKGMKASRSFVRLARAAPMVALISPMPGMKTRMSPGSPELTICSTTSAACSVIGPLVMLAQIADLDRKAPPFGTQDRRLACPLSAVQVFGYRLRFERRRHDGHLQIGPLRSLQPLHQRQRHVAQQVALVELIEDDHAHV